MNTTGIESGPLTKTADCITLLVASRPPIPDEQIACWTTALRGWWLPGMAVRFWWPTRRRFCSAEFVLPLYGRADQPEYQIQIHIRRPDALTLDGAIVIPVDQDL